MAIVGQGGGRGEEPGRHTCSEGFGRPHKWSTFGYSALAALALALAGRTSGFLPNWFYSFVLWVGIAVLFFAHGLGARHCRTGLGLTERQPLWLFPPTTCDKRFKGVPNRRGAI